MTPACLTQVGRHRSPADLRLTLPLREGPAELRDGIRRPRRVPLGGGERGADDGGAGLAQRAVLQLLRHRPRLHPRRQFRGPRVAALLRARRHEEPLAVRRVQGERPPHRHLGRT